MVNIPHPQSHCVERTGAGADYGCSMIMTEPTGYGRALWANDFEFTSNLVVAPRGQTHADHLNIFDPASTAAMYSNCTIDRNLYFSATASPRSNASISLPGRESLPTWLSKHDQHSLFGVDPLLNISAAAGGALLFSLAPNSPARRPPVSFRTWDWDRVGPRYAVGPRDTTGD